MPYDIRGNFTRLHNWEEDRQNDVEILSDRHDEEDDNFAGGLNECFLRDGRVEMKGNFNAGNYQVKNVAQATSDNDAVNLAQVNNIKNAAMQDCKDIISSLFYIGDIKPSLQSANHGDWLLCDGQAVSRNDYAALFDIIGTRFGGGDGVNTFNVPDYRGKFLRGLGGNSEADIYTTQAEGLPNITGTWKSYGVSVGGGTIEATGALTEIENNLPGSDGYGTNKGGIGLDASQSNAIYGASNHVTPVNQAVNWFIKAKGI